ncbi:kinase-like domain-containing protein [Thelonectria olida]|uniref:Kinase-like domain-containing protein n=1 Tax=Thelonectria olida TaxID=1576542 RepID=A0A9P9AJM0_9HYPO|nr:kinase-like domain-containing protein [Thelonectria olida]
MDNNHQVDSGQPHPGRSIAADSAVQGPEEKTEDKVYVQISKKLLPESKENSKSSNQFIPLRDLKYILSPNVVAKLLEEASLTSIMQPGQPDPIFGSEDKPRRIKILGILILTGGVDYIKHFCNNGPDDEKLPLSRDSNFFKSNNWKQRLIDEFCRRQYEMLAPDFNFSNREVQDFLINYPLPFLKELDWKVHGAHGLISKAYIHPDYQIWSGSNSKLQQPFYAIKKFFPNNSTHFANERNALQRFGGQREGHKNLLTLLLSYQRGGESFMIFPWAEGNLVDFWKKEPTANPPSPKDLIWLIQQCQGIASGLSKVHRYEHGNFQGRHGDIKPENILFFREAGSERGLLVVADFTLMRFHSQNTMNVTGAGEVGYTSAYCPPEVKVTMEASINQKYDIWTLGCVYLEFITWYLLGYNATRGPSFTMSGKEVQSFLAARTKEHNGPYTYGRDNFFIIPGKQGAEWIKMLRGDNNCSEALQEFLTLVEGHMLVPEQGDRCCMDHVLRTLEAISSKCGYCCVGKPKPRDGDAQFPPLATAQVHPL